MSSPYDTPRVIRAIIEDLIEHLAVNFYGSKATPQLLAVVKTVIDSRLARVYFRGTQLTRLFLVEPRLDGAVLTFTFRKLCEDGEWLLRQMDLVHEIPKVPMEVSRRLEVKRIVDL